MADAPVLQHRHLAPNVGQKVVADLTRLEDGELPAVDLGEGRQRGRFADLVHQQGSGSPSSGLPGHQDDEGLSFEGGAGGRQWLFVLDALDPDAAPDPGQELRVPLVPPDDLDEQRLTVAVGVPEGLRIPPPRPPAGSAFPGRTRPGAGRRRWHRWGESGAVPRAATGPVTRPPLRSPASATTRAEAPTPWRCGRGRPGTRLPNPLAATFGWPRAPAPRLPPSPPPGRWPRETRLR